MREPSDAEVIAAAVADAKQFDLIFQRHHTAVYRYLRRRVESGEAADLAAETFVTALGRCDRFDIARGSARAWLLGIATNLLRHHWRRERRRLRAYARTGVDPLISDFEAVEERTDAERMGPQLAGGLGSLRGADRDVLLLFAWEGLSPPEIAAALDIPVGTVHSRLSRARKQMREAISASGQ